ncbi:MAG TPA: hypothetical protein VMZ52_08615 [Bryobacteraceae bacterium]|nr:hypothetical protein [Bryobacteraceae bacterium]
MFRHPIFALYGLTLLGFASVADYQGWSLLPVHRTENVPRSVRDNPGAYRSIYSGYSRYSGGK